MLTLFRLGKTILKVLEYLIEVGKRRWLINSYRRRLFILLDHSLNRHLSCLLENRLWLRVRLSDILFLVRMCHHGVFTRKLIDFLRMDHTSLIDICSALFRCDLIAALIEFGDRFCHIRLTRLVRLLCD